jgi:hypothetical protein
MTNSEINSITSVYYIASFYKYLLQVQEGLSSGKDTILPHADDRGFTRLEEIFIKELIVFWAESIAAICRKKGKCEYIKYSASVENNDMQAYNKKVLTSGSTIENST